LSVAKRITPLIPKYRKNGAVLSVEHEPQW